MPATKINTEMHMSPEKGLARENVKITKITKAVKSTWFTKCCKASNENQRRKLMQMSPEKAHTHKIVKIMKIIKFARSSTKINAEMQMSLWKAPWKTAEIMKIRKVVKITKINLQNFEKPATKINAEMQMSTEKCPTRNCENYKNYKSCKKYEIYKIFQSHQRKSTQKCKWVYRRPHTKLWKLQNLARPPTKIKKTQKSKWVQRRLHTTVKITEIDHFTVVCLVTWPLNGSEAGGDLVLIQTLLFLCKSSCSYAN